MSKVSVIIPVYNAGEYISKTLESVISQSYKDFEVICINDKSTDNSLEILKNFQEKDDRIKIINNEKNMGAALTRNVGIDKATGKYIYFLDADDYIDEKYLECMVNTIERENCDIILNLSIFNISNGNINLYKHPSMPEVSKDGEYIGNITAIHDAPCFIWARFYRKSFLDQNNLRFIDTHADDVVFNAITSIQTDKTFVFFGADYYYTIHDNSMVGSVNSQNLKDLQHIKAHSLIYDYLKQNNIFNDRLKLFRVYPFVKVDTEEKFNCYKMFFEKIKDDFQKNENIYNDLEKFFAYSLLDSENYEEYLKNYNKVVTIGFIRRGKK